MAEMLESFRELDTLGRVGLFVLFAGGALSLRWLRSLGSNMRQPEEDDFQTLFKNNDTGETRRYALHKKDGVCVLGDPFRPVSVASVNREP